MTEQPKNPKPRARSRPQRVTVAERQTWAFLLYEGMGSTRNLISLADVVRAVGIQRAGVKTLARWSAKYQWQRRLMERQVTSEGEITQRALDVKKAMEDRHVGLFQALETLAREGLKNQFSEVERRAAAGLVGLEMTPEAILRLADGVQRGERLARGEATSKAQVVIQVVGPLVKDIFAVFMAVNVITNDPLEMQRKRLAEFIKRGDEILGQYYLEEGTGQ